MFVLHLNSLPQKYFEGVPSNKPKPTLARPIVFQYASQTRNGTGTSRNVGQIKILHFGSYSLKRCISSKVNMLFKQTTTLL